MTPEQIISIIQAARAAGIDSLKIDGLEFGVNASSHAVTIANSTPLMNPVQTSGYIQQVSTTPEEEKEIKHKVEQFKSVMGLGNEELVDLMFPPGPNPLAEVS